MIVNKGRRIIGSGRRVRRRVFVAVAAIFGAACVGVFVLRSFPLRAGGAVVEVVAHGDGNPDDVRVVLAGEPMDVALERRLLRAISRKGAGAFEGLAADAASLLSAMASGRLAPLWAIYESAGGEFDRALASEYRDFLRTWPANRRPEGWEAWSDFEALMRANQPLVRAWRSVPLHRITVVLPEDVERPSSAWPPLDQRAVGRGPPLWKFPMADALLESGAPLVGFDIEYVVDGQGRFVSRFWFVRVGEGSWYHALTDTLVAPSVEDRRRMF